jgi:predicted Zn-dependent peptidase
MADLDAASLEDVVAFFKAWYGPNNAVISVVGDVDEEPTFEAIERFFGPIPPIRAIPPFVSPPTPDILGAEIRSVVPDAVPLARAHFGFRMPAYGTREFDAIEVGTQILAGGRGSRLYKRLVREERIAQDVAAFALPLVSGHSIYAGWVTARPESDMALAERVYLEELERMASELVTDDELGRALALIESSEFSAISRVEEVADRLNTYATYFDRPELINEQLGRYKAVDAEAIRSASAQVFREDNRAVITYVPAEPGPDGGRDRGPDADTDGADALDARGDDS